MDESNFVLRELTVSTGQAPSSPHLAWTSGDSVYVISWWMPIIALTSLFVGIGLRSLGE